MRAAKDRAQSLHLCGGPLPAGEERSSATLGACSVTGAGDDGRGGVGVLHASHCVDKLGKIIHLAPV